MRKRVGFVWIAALALSIASLAGTGINAEAKSSGKYVSDLQFSFTKDGVVPGARNEHVPDPDNWDLIGPDTEGVGDIDMEGDMSFAYAKAYVKRTDDANKALRDIQVRTDYTGDSERNLKDVNGKTIIYQSILPQTNIYNALYTTRKISSGDPICDVYFVKDSLDCNGVEYALNRYEKSNPIPETSYSARAYFVLGEKYPVYTVAIKDNIAKRYVSDLVLAKGKTDKVKKKVRYAGCTIIKTVELGGKTFTLGIKRTDKAEEALRGVYFVKDGNTNYKLYTTKSKGAGTPIVDVCPQKDMLVEEGVKTTIGDWAKKYFLGDGFRKFVKEFIEKSDSAYKKTKSSTLSIVSGEVKMYDDLSVLKADMGFEESVLEGIDVAAGSRTADSIAVVRRIGDATPGDIVIDSVEGTGTSDLEKLESYRKQLGSSDEDVTEPTPAQEENEGDAVSPSAASTTGSIMSGGVFLWILIPVAVALIGVVIIVYIRRKKRIS